MRRARLPRLVVAALALVASKAHAEVAEPSGRADSAFDFMNLLSQHGLHDLRDEEWNAYGQITDIWSQKLGFAAKYTNLHGTPGSLVPTQELSFTETATLYLGLRLWPGAEAYFVPEVIGEKPLSGLHGLGGTIQNFELQKQGSSIPTPYLSRAYVQQTINLGGTRVEKPSDPGQIAHAEDRRRVMLRLGNFSVLDVFDKNDFGDLRRTFLNMAFLTYAAYDFAADARGFAWGGIAELDYDDWSVRFGRATPPKDPNQLPLDFRLDQVYGDQLELEHDHKILGQTGVIRVLGYRNQENMARFADAIAAYEADHAADAAACGARFNYGSANGSAPDLCWARRPNVKVGVGVSVTQQVGPLGLFFRAMYSDGQTEVYSFTSTDRSISFGSITRGSVWRRPGDAIGLGWSQGWISQVHGRYLGLGGVDGFIGDGKIKQAAEGVVEGYYSLGLGASAWLTADYQLIYNPAFNADRGPVNVFGGRIHVEF